MATSEATTSRIAGEDVSMETTKPLEEAASSHIFVANILLQENPTSLHSCGRTFKLAVKEPNWHERTIMVSKPVFDSLLKVHERNDETLKPASIFVNVVEQIRPGETVDSSAHMKNNDLKIAENPDSISQDAPFVNSANCKHSIPDNNSGHSSEGVSLLKTPQFNLADIADNWSTLDKGVSLLKSANCNGPEPGNSSNSSSQEVSLLKSANCNRPESGNNSNAPNQGASLLRRRYCKRPSPEKESTSSNEGVSSPKKRDCNSAEPEDNSNSSRQAGSSLKTANENRLQLGSNPSLSSQGVSLLKSANSNRTEPGKKSISSSKGVSVPKKQDGKRSKPETNSNSSSQGVSVPKKGVCKRPEPRNNFNSASKGVSLLKSAYCDRPAPENNMSEVNTGPPALPEVNLQNSENPKSPEITHSNATFNIDSIRIEKVFSCFEPVKAQIPRKMLPTRCQVYRSISKRTSPNGFDAKERKKAACISAIRKLLQEEELKLKTSLIKLGIPSRTASAILRTKEIFQDIMKKEATFTKTNVLRLIKPTKSTSNGMKNIPKLVGKRLARSLDSTKNKVQKAPQEVIIIDSDDSDVETSEKTPVDHLKNKLTHKTPKIQLEISESDTESEVEKKSEMPLLNEIVNSVNVEVQKLIRKHHGKELPPSSIEGLRLIKKGLEILKIWSEINGKCNGTPCRKTRESSISTFSADSRNMDEELMSYEERLKTLEPVQPEHKEKRRKRKRPIENDEANVTLEDPEKSLHAKAEPLAVEELVIVKCETVTDVEESNFVTSTNVKAESV